MKKMIFLHDNDGNFVGKFYVETLDFGRFPKVVLYCDTYYTLDESSFGVYRESGISMLTDEDRLIPNMREVRKR